MLPHWLEILIGAIPWTGGETSPWNIPAVEFFFLVTDFAHIFFGIPENLLFATLEASRVVLWTDYAQDLVSMINTVTTFAENLTPKIWVFGVVKVPFFVLHRPHYIFLLWVQPKQVVIEFEFIWSV